MAKFGVEAAHWKGGKSMIDGYVQILSPNHPRKTLKGYVREHILIAEKALGRLLPSKAVVHHHNEIRSDNRNENLVICEDETYHKHLHVRMRAFQATGQARLRKCRYCKEYDNPENLTAHRWHPYHSKCHAGVQRYRRYRKKVNALLTL